MAVLTAASLIPAASGQNYEVAAGELLMPFSQLNSTPAGQQALQDNLDTALFIQNNATPAQQTQAIKDATTDFDYATSMATGLGPTYTQGYFNALYSNNPLIQPEGDINRVIEISLANTENGAGFAKTFFGNGDAQGQTISFPAGGIPNTYGQAYVPGVSPDPNPNGDPRPFQVAPYVGGEIVVFSGYEFIAPRPDNSPPPVGPYKSNMEINIESGLTTSPAFPSGHSTYAYTSAIVFGMMVPEKYQAMLGRASEYANHRIVMGAHYPLDLMGGRTTATYIMAQVLNHEGNLAFLESTAEEFRGLIGAGEGVNVLENGLSGAELEAMREDFIYRMTYDLTPTHATDLPAIAPEGSEVLLATRFPYLSDAQRNEVLRTTMIDSGAPLDNTDPDYAGWFRLDLFSAVGGYGSFASDTTVNMDAANGGFYAQDVWNNNITGPGRLIKQGSGELYLTGDNSFGGFDVQGGKLALTRTNMLMGDNTVGGGSGTATLQVSGGLANNSLDIQTNGRMIVKSGGYVMTVGNLNISGENAVVDLFVAGDAQLAAGNSGIGSFNNSGRVNFIANPELGSGPLAPISVGNEVGFITGTDYHGYGGVWDVEFQQFVVSEKVGVLINPLTHSGGVDDFDASAARLWFVFEAGVSELLATFGADAGVVNFHATQLGDTTINGKEVIAAYDFATSPGLQDVFLSFLLPEGADALFIWHRENSESAWELYETELTQNYQGWLTFQADGFSSYAVTVPEPGAWPLLGLCLALTLLIRRRRAC